MPMVHVMSLLICLAQAGPVEADAGHGILKIVHILPTDVAAQDALLQTLAEQGFGGIVTNVSFHDYLVSEENWAAFLRVTGEARARGMKVWLYDEKGYPSGNAGGLTLKEHPEWEARGLLCIQKRVDTAGGEVVTLDVPPGTLRCAVALDNATGARADIGGVVAGGTLAWTAPAGSWTVMAITESNLFDGTHASMNLHMKIPYVNLMMAEPTARFIELTHDEYARRLGADLGRHFVATFTDEPSLMSLFMREMPYGALPWSPSFAEEFRKLHGYDIEPSLPLLVAGNGPGAAKIRYDFWHTVGRLVEDNFFGQLQTWCRQHNTQSGGHLLCEESLIGDVGLYGDFFACTRRLDAPSIDCLTSIPEEVAWYIARVASSAAELEGRGEVMSETSDHCQVYRPEGDTRPVRIVTEDEIRGTCGKLILNGITTHTSYYSFKERTPEELQRINQWIARCSGAMKGGRQAADVAVVYPVESIWPKYMPSRRWTEDVSPETEAIERSYRGAMNGLYTSGRDFTVVDSRALMDAAVSEGALVHGELRWKALVLPRVDTLREEAWKRIGEAIDGGVVVVALGVKPENSERDFPSPVAQAVAAKLVTPGEAASGPHGIWLGPGNERLLPVMLRGVMPDFDAGPDSPLRVTHRTIGGRERYMVFNDSRAAWEGLVWFRAQGAGSMMNPADGARVDGIDAAGSRVAIESFGARIFDFDKAAPATVTVAAPVLGQPTPLTPSAVGKGAGEFVQGDVAPVENTPGAYRLPVRITKSDTDTFAFLCYEFDAPVDLSKIPQQVVAIDLACDGAPDRPIDLLLILVDAAGHEHATSTGIFFGAQGTQPVYMPLSAFTPAAWRPQPEGPFDRTAIKTIRIGWGGYKGKEGQTLSFTASALRAY